MAEKDTNSEFKGFSRPTTTPIPDELFDQLLPDLSGAELKVLLYICRRTFGFKKDSDEISIAQIMKGITTKDGRVLDRGTGLAKDTVARALKGLEKKNAIVTSRRTSPEKGHEPNTYSLNFLPLSENRTREGVKIGQGLVRKSDIQQTVLQQTDVVVIDQLIEKEISKDKAQELTANYSREHLQEKIEFLEWKLKLQAQGKARGRPIGDPAAWLIKAIEKDYKPPDEFFDWLHRREEIERQEAGEQKELEERKKQQQQIRERLREQAGASPDPELEQVWRQTLADLKEKVTEAAYQTWLAASVLLLLEEAKATGEVEAVIGFPNAYALDKVETQWVPLIRDTLSKHLDDQQVTLNFIALDQSQESDTEPS